MQKAQQRRAGMGAKHGLVADLLVLTGQGAQCTHSTQQREGSDGEGVAMAYAARHATVGFENGTPRIDSRLMEHRSFPDIVADGIAGLGNRSVSFGVGFRVIKDRYNMEIEGHGSALHVTTFV